MAHHLLWIAVECAHCLQIAIAYSCYLSFVIFNCEGLPPHTNLLIALKPSCAAVAVSISLVMLAAAAASTTECLVHLYRYHSLGAAATQ
jgi:hypothetical protein